MRRRRILRWWPAIPVVVTALVIYAAWPGRSTFTVSAETTLITDPVDAEGYVDYPTALNQRLSQNVTPERNANVLIWQAFGPHPEGGTMPPAFFKWLGVDSPPERGEYFISWDKYSQANLGPPPNDVLELFDIDDDGKETWQNRVDKAMKWPWKMSEQQAIAGWLKQNEKPVALLVEASKRPDYYNPLVSKSSDPRSARVISCLLPSVQKCREVARLLTCRAMAHVADGDYDAAWEDLIACHRLGRLLSKSGTLIETLVGIAIESIAANAELTFLSHGNHSSEQIRKWMDELQKLPPSMPLADKLDLTERYMMLDSMQSIAIVGARKLSEFDFPGPSSRSKDPVLDKLFTRSVDFDPAFRNANQMYDRCVAACRKPDRATRKQELAAIEMDLKKTKSAVAELSAFDKLTMGKTKRGEQIGNILNSLLFPAVQKIQDACDRSAQINDNLRVAFALAAYRADHKQYPTTLDELAPKYLIKVPGDLFSGMALTYRKIDDGYLLYSFGVNELDDDGQWIDDDPKGDDPRVRMPVTEPKERPVFQFQRPGFPGGAID